MTTMQIDRAVVEQALDFIVATNKSFQFWLVPESNLNKKTVTALRAALAQQAEPLNLRDPAVQKRLATQWGYVPAAQAEPVEPVATLIARRNDILRMAHEAGLCDANGEDDDSVNIAGQLERFAALVAAAEREACAKVCENIEEWQGEGSLELDPYYSDTYAAAIRARNNT